MSLHYIGGRHASDLRKMATAQRSRADIEGFAPLHLSLRIRYFGSLSPFVSILFQKQAPICLATHPTRPTFLTRPAHILSILFATETLLPRTSTTL